MADFTKGKATGDSKDAPFIVDDDQSTDDEYFDELDLRDAFQDIVGASQDVVESLRYLVDRWFPAQKPLLDSQISSLPLICKYSDSSALQTLMGTVSPLTQLLGTLHPFLNGVLTLLLSCTSRSKDSDSPSSQSLLQSLSNHGTIPAGQLLPTKSSGIQPPTSSKTTTMNL